MKFGLQMEGLDLGLDLTEMMVMVLKAHTSSDALTGDELLPLLLCVTVLLMRSATFLPLVCIPEEGAYMLRLPLTRANVVYVLNAELWVRSSTSGLHWAKMIISSLICTNVPEDA
jgi:hypothetical protein